MCEYMPGYSILQPTKVPHWGGSRFDYAINDQIHVSNTCTIDNIFYIVAAILENFPHIRKEIKTVSNENTKKIVSLLETVRREHYTKDAWTDAKFSYVLEINTSLSPYKRVYDLFGCEWDFSLQYLSSDFRVITKYTSCDSCKFCRPQIHSNQLQIKMSEAKQGSSIQEQINLFLSTRDIPCNNTNFDNDNKPSKLRKIETIGENNETY